MSSNSAADVLEEAIRKIRQDEWRLTSEFARMTDDELGTWIIEQGDTQECIVNIITYVGEKRLCAALKNIHVKYLAKFLNNAALDLLIEYDEIDEIKMPPRLEDMDEEQIAKAIWELSSTCMLDEVAMAIVSLHREGKLLELLSKLMLTNEDVAKLLVELYNEILDD